MSDMVSHPPHYTHGGIECIDAMEACSSTEEFVGHCRLTALKYLWRLYHKDEPVENLQKAVWYLNKAIEKLRKEQAPTEQLQPSAFIKQCGHKLGVPCD